MEVGTAMSLRQMKIVQKNVTASKEENSTSEVEFFGLEVGFFSSKPSSHPSCRNGEKNRSLARTRVSLMLGFCFHCLRKRR